MVKHNNNWSEDVARAVLQKYEQSGMKSLKEFSRVENISIHKLRWWRLEIKRRQQLGQCKNNPTKNMPALRILPVKLVGTLPEATKIEIESPEVWIIKISGKDTVHQIQSVVAALRAPTC